MLFRSYKYKSWSKLYAADQRNLKTPYILDGGSNRESMRLYCPFKDTDNGTTKYHRCEIAYWYFEVAYLPFFYNTLSYINFCILDYEPCVRLKWRTTTSTTKLFCA